MEKIAVKRSFDMRIIGDWVEPESRVLDLGCGRGDLLDYLVQARAVSAVGVDIDFANVTACVSRGAIAMPFDPDGSRGIIPSSSGLGAVGRP